MQLSDTLTLDAPRRTADGYMAASVRAARTGIQEYTGAEVGKPDMRIVRVLRPEAEVFHKDSLRTLAHRPVTIDHPPVAVNATNWRDYAVGLTGDEIARDGEFIRVPLAIMDEAAITAVTNGKNQLSCGYTCDLDWTAGAHNGVQYDAIQTNIRFNHLSAVGAARGGPSLRIGDTKPMKTIVHDGISIEFADQAADAYNSLAAKLATATADIARLTKDVATADGKTAKAEAERDAATSKIVTPAQLDAAVTKRADLIATARAIAPAVVTDGKSEAEIKSAVVAAAGVAIADKPAAYIDARFDIMAEEAKAHGNVHDALRTSQPTLTGQRAVDAAAIKSAEDQNAWRTAKH